VLFQPLVSDDEPEPIVLGDPHVDVTRRGGLDPPDEDEQVNERTEYYFGSGGWCRTATCVQEASVQRNSAVTECGHHRLLTRGNRSI
jgi:hypothetical protein